MYQYGTFFDSECREGKSRLQITPGRGQGTRRLQRHRGRMLWASLRDPQEKSTPWKGGKEGIRAENAEKLCGVSLAFIHGASEPVINAPAAVSGDEAVARGRGGPGMSPIMVGCWCCGSFSRSFSRSRAATVRRSWLVM